MHSLDRTPETWRDLPTTGINPPSLHWHGFSPCAVRTAIFFPSYLTCRLPSGFGPPASGFIIISAAASEVQYCCRTETFSPPEMVPTIVARVSPRMVQSSAVEGMSSSLRVWVTPTHLYFIFIFSKLFKAYLKRSGTTTVPPNMKRPTQCSVETVQGFLDHSRGKYAKCTAFAHHQTSVLTSSGRNTTRTSHLETSYGQGAKVDKIEGLRE